MNVVSTVQEIRALRRCAGGSVGFVPTMGYLHEGHLSLVRAARRENEVVVASIFVNPLQFGPQEDYQRYPRDPERDLALLQQEGTDIIFMPSVAELYPEGFTTYVEVGSVTERLEGECRPGHFRGVATIVAKLFNIVQPHRAYFGQKDAQQTVVIRKMVADLNLDTEIVVMPTVREPDGLAMSSRNVYLNATERQAALVLWRSLCLACQLWTDGERDAECIRQAMLSLIAQEPLAKVDYVSIAHSETLAELSRIDSSTLVSLAVRIGNTRLIDNLVLG